ncbi:MAG TPA: hypothetical protein DHV60_10055 [Verrucomicrobiales bacterium]|nr:hypothetical protein [Verrucomicrobiales bacterium]
MIRFLYLLPISIVSILGISQGEERVVSYNREVRPILSENCFTCHGFDKDKREADLRLDTEKGAKESAIVAGNAKASELFKRIVSRDPDEVMPPADSIYKLTPSQVETLQLWIDQGAKYEEHWAYKNLKLPAVPDFGETGAIDSFLQRTWKEYGVSPVVKADPRVLIRRLSFDLRGLPPTPEEVTAFENDHSPTEYARLVKRWTESVEHAEHQGLLWLDLVRWADSSGMVSDEPIATGHYRKYVIKAFRDNIPFDRFTREQLAGDLLPKPTWDALVASGYNRLVKTNSEAGVIEKEALHALKGEHVRSLGTVWLGATTGCAECHDHKYDPISARDYYALGAFFDDLIEVGVYQPGDRRAPIHYLHNEPVNMEKDRELSAIVESLRQELYGIDADAKEIVDWEKEFINQSNATKKKKGTVDWPWVPAALPAAKVIKGDFTITPDGRVTTAGTGELHRHSAGEFLSPDPAAGKAKGYYVEATLDPADTPELIAVQLINGAYGRVGWHQEYHSTFYWGPKDHALLKKVYPWLDPKNLVYLGDLPEAGKRVRLDIPANKIPKMPYATAGMAWLHVGGKVTWGNSGYHTDPHHTFLNGSHTSLIRYWWDLPLNRDDRNKFPTLVGSSIRMAKKDRRPIHEKVIRVAFAESKRPDSVVKLNDLLRRLALLRRHSETALVSKTGPRKTTRLLKRGNFMDDSGPRLDPAIPAYFAKGKTKDQLLTRLDLANWLTAPENPMTARVFVNRLWHQFYGRGISATLVDSGNQGDWPSHPDLLDWLAMEFIESGWDIRHMIRLMVSTKAYQLSSIPNTEVAVLDPGNRLITHQSRHRLGAEEIRDTALSAAGVLRKTEKIPARSFYPYQPDAYWKKSNKIMLGSRYQIWDTDKGNNQYQRSLYTYWKRQNPHPSMLAFDAPTRQECTAERAITNSPGQALAMLNDPTYIEASRLLARRTMLSAQDSTARLKNLFKFALQRPPSEKEIVILEIHLKKWMKYYQKHPDEATNLLKIGQPQTEAALPVSEHAAWSNMARMILNLHEFITRS